MNQSISTSSAPEVIIEEILGDLQVKGWDQDEVVVKANPDDVTLEEQEDVIRLSCRGSCTLRVPTGAILQVDKVQGEARFKLLEDQLKIDEVNSSLILRSVAETHIGIVQGNLHCRDIAGDLSVDQVEGNAEVRTVEGDCRLDNIDGNVELRDIQGDCSVENVGGNAEVRDVDGSLSIVANGNAWVRLSQLSGSDYNITGHGNLFCQLPEDTSARLQMRSGANNIQLKLPTGSRRIQEAYVEEVIGEGDANLELQAGANLTVKVLDVREAAEEAEGAFGQAFADIPQSFEHQIAQQIEAQMEAVTRQINEQLADLSARIGKSGLTPEETEEIMQRARESSERAAARAQERMRRAQEKLERKVEEARRRSEAKARAAERRAQGRRRTWSFQFSGGPTPPPPPKDPVSDEERLLILRMLEQKKISLEEADALLAALEGREE